MLKQRAVKKVALLLITGDRGLAGAYNANILRKAFDQIDEWEGAGVDVNLVTVGRKGRDLMLRHGPPLRAEFTGLSARPTSNDIAPVAAILLEDFIAGQFDAVYMAYTHFVTTLRQEPIAQAAAADRARRVAA